MRRPRSPVGEFFALVTEFLILVAVCGGATAAAQDGAGPKALALRVVDGKSQSPVKDVDVTVNFWGTDEKERKLKTDAQGSCRIDLPQSLPRYLGIAVRGKGYVPMRLRWENKPGGASTIPNEYTLAMEPGTTLSGRVLDDTGKPVEGATVMLHIRSKNRDAVQSYDVVYTPITTDKDGRWSYHTAPAAFEAVNIGTYHLKYAIGAFYPMNAFEPHSALRDGSATVRLPRGVPVEGVVLGAEGKPVKGAAVGVGRDRVASNVTPEFNTDEQGKFSFAAQPGEQCVITVKAKGHAPELQEFLADRDVDGAKAKQVTFRLQPAKTLRGRVVDAQGKPVPKATVYTDTWRGKRTLNHRLETDAEGRFTWDGAPADAVQCDIFKMGYADLRQHALTASDKEVTVTLRKPLKVRGTVVDAETGKPLEKFSVIQGLSFSDSQPVHWQRREGQEKPTGKDGKFEYEQSYPYPGYAVRVEADGYLPAESRVFRMDEGEVALELKLRKGQGITGVVRGADGKPAAGAKVVVATPSNTAYIHNGKDINDQGCATATADNEGRYSLPPQVGPHMLVFIHENGYAELPGEQAAKSADVTLAQWGRVEGRVTVGTKPAADSELSLYHVELGRYDPKAPRIHHQVDARSDGEGKFVFERVRPGEANVNRTIRMPMGNGGWMNPATHSARVKIEPGKTIQVVLGGTGRPVVGRLRIPDEVKKLPSWHYYMCSLTTKVDYPKLEVPDNVKELPPEERQKWHEAFMKSPEGQAYQKKMEEAQQQHRSYALVMAPDGAFRADDVPAGTYTLSVSIAKANPDGSCGPGDVVATAGGPVTVPEMPGGRSDEPLEVPSLEMTLRKTVNVGDVAPAFVAKTVDGKELRLEDLKGKYVLLDFWATWCGPCIGETPNLKATYEAFGKDGRLVMVGLSLDEKPEAPKKYAEKNGLGWVQGFLGEWSTSKVPDMYGVTGIPSIWLIGPEGKVIAKDLRGERIKSEVEKALSASASR
ncbi:MAG TPA: carboxypeptidase regulatory-like domain-containing protein [Tepidisphaeraceae bacterium]|nr:carboxypeptidase regulatory-like domain-containing protein [Tepidisphaeraceae bacterium]